MKNHPKALFPPHSLFFAPMEGITDEAYRLSIDHCFGEWDFYACDFLRVPTTGLYSKMFLLEHFGEEIYKRAPLKAKTIFQILTSERSNYLETVAQIRDLGFTWIDLNLGCPSRTVNSHRGGAYLLQDPETLREIIKSIRQSFPHTFTAKMRIGYHDDSYFETIVKMLEEEGVEAITIHARTRDQLYQGTADWKYIKEAVKWVKIPVIGNGDIWEIKDIEKIFNETNCHSVMLGRSALKTPWMAKLYKDYLKNPAAFSVDLSSLNDLRKHYIPLYYFTFEQEMRKKGVEEGPILKRFKSISRYLFLDFPNGEEIRGKLLRSQSLGEFQKELDSL